MDGWVGHFYHPGHVGRMLDPYLLTQTPLRAAPLNRNTRNRTARCQSSPAFIKINNNWITVEAGGAQVNTCSTQTQTHPKRTRAEISNCDNWEEQMSTGVDTEHQHGENITLLNHNLTNCGDAVVTN